MIEWFVVIGAILVAFWIYAIIRVGDSRWWYR